MTRAVHVAHPPVQEAGLADGCPACTEIAADPTAHLDDATLAQLATLTVATDRLERGRSENELVAAANLLSTLERVGKLAETAPSVVAWYLREKWRLDVQIDNPLMREARAQVADMLSDTSAQAAAEQPDVEVDDDGFTPEQREWIRSDPVCTCDHRLSEHADPDSPEGHAGCRAQVATEEVDVEKGVTSPYTECPCSGFISRDLAEEWKPSDPVWPPSS